MINIKVNNKTHQLQSGSSLQSLLNALHISFNGIAVAVNKKIITQVDWEHKTLSQGDDIIIITATQGG